MDATALDYFGLLVIVMVWVVMAIDLLNCRMRPACCPLPRRSGRPEFFQPEPERSNP